MLLPTPRAHSLPDDATIAVPVPPGGLTLYRLLESESPRLEDFEPVWTRPQAQLRRIPELFRVSISHWLELEQALLASERRLAFVARLELEPDPLVHAALTEQEARGHVDVWANPHVLLRAVADVVRRRLRS
jgi:hypothetical protein